MVQCCFLSLLAWVYLLTSVTQLSGLQSESFEARKRLVEKLTNNSALTKEFLPVVDGSKNVRLKVGMTIQRIATVDEVNQAMRLIVWLRLTWNNPFLSWKPEDYNNVSSIHLDNQLIWTPDFTLYNKASLEEEIDILYKRMTTSIVVGHDGSCKWNAPATLLSQCKINVVNFPFDEQKCELTFGSWTYAANEIDVYPEAEHATLKFFTPNGEWEIMEAPMRRNQKTYPAGIFPDVTLYLRIKRRPLYYTLNLIIPCTVISMLSFLTFILPTKHGERVSLVITVLLAMSVYMLIVSSTLPQTSDAMPLIGTYFLCIIVEIALCLFATCFVARIREHETEIPKWLDFIVNKKLSRWLFMELPVNDYARAKTNESYENHLDLITAHAGEHDTNAKLEVRCRGMDKVVSELAVLTDDLTIGRKREARSRKWYNAAAVFDRLFLLIFMFAFVIVTAAIFG